jgi:hypothetical protein
VVIGWFGLDWLHGLAGFALEVGDTVGGGREPHPPQIPAAGDGAKPDGDGHHLVPTTRSGGEIRRELSGAARGIPGVPVPRDEDEDRAGQRPRARLGASAQERETAATRNPASRRGGRRRPMAGGEGRRDEDAAQQGATGGSGGGGEHLGQAGHGCSGWL